MTKMNCEQPAVGIDLGTTYSSVAYMDSAGRPATIPNESGDLLTPSAVFVDEDEIIVGKEAVKASTITPAAYAECFKRDIGGAAFRRTLCGRSIPPEVLSAFVLERLRRDAERRLGSFQKAVVTVPAFFDEIRRRMTQDAARLSGLNILDIINEPTAAAVAYGHDFDLLDSSNTVASNGPLRLLIYDLGGGTFDVTVLEIDGKRFRTMATDGDVRLGGKDFDKRLVDHIAETFLEAHGVDPRSDPQDTAQLWLDALEAKHALSERSKTTVVCFHAGIRMRIEISRREFEELTADLVERTETTASLVVRQAGLDWESIDRILLVGGASRMPMVRSMLRELTGREPDCSQSPDEVVAHGAALYARDLLAKETDSGNSECELINVNSHSLGVVGKDLKTGRQESVILIPKNTPLPARASKLFTVARPNQRSVRVPVVEGESQRPEDCIALGECVVRGLPPDLTSDTKIEVEYNYATNGCISVIARIPSIRHSAHVEIERRHEASQDDLHTWRNRLLGRLDEGSRKLDQAASLATVDPSDRDSVQKRIDTLLTRVGKAAMKDRVPEELTKSQRAALTAASGLKDARRILQKARNAEVETLHDPGALQRNADIPQAEASCQKAQVRADFSYLVLGRECVERGFIPPGIRGEIDEILQLRQQIGETE